MKFSVDDLFTRLEDWCPSGRAEVLGGRLLLGPPQSRQHERVVRHLATRCRAVLPAGADLRTHEPVRLPDGDGPVPDLLVAAASDWPRGVPAGYAYTAVEVVAADGRHIDRVWKRDAYAAAGIPCYWRVDLVAWSGYQGPLPVVVIRVREPGGWREIVAGPGRVHDLPLAYARDLDGTAVSTPVRLDPGTLTSRLAADR